MKLKITAAIAVTAAGIMSASSPSFLTLAWDSQPDVDAYRLYSTNNLSTPFMSNAIPLWPCIATVTTNFIAIAGLTPGQQYFFVTASNAWGESMPSNLLRMPNPNTGVSNLKTTGIK